MSGTGPDAIRGKTYFEIQMEQAELDGSIRQRKPGLDAVPVLKPGEVPRIPGYTWNTGDRAPEPPWARTMTADAATPIEAGIRAARKRPRDARGLGGAGDDMVATRV